MNKFVTESQYLQSNNNRLKSGVFTYCSCNEYKGQQIMNQIWKKYENDSNKSKEWSYYTKDITINDIEINRYR